MIGINRMTTPSSTPSDLILQRPWNCIPNRAFDVADATNIDMHSPTQLRALAAAMLPRCGAASEASSLTSEDLRSIQAFLPTSDEYRCSGMGTPTPTLIVEPPPCAADGRGRMEQVALSYDTSIDHLSTLGTNAVPRVRASRPVIDRFVVTIRLPCTGHAWESLRWSIYRCSGLSDGMYTVRTETWSEVTVKAGPIEAQIRRALKAELAYRRQFPTDPCMGRFTDALLVIAAQLRALRLDDAVAAIERHRLMDARRR